MNTSQDIPWKRLFAEAVAIVGSILLAFTIDAWWDDQKDQAQLNELLGAVREDFLGAKETISFRLTFSRAKLTSITNLIDVSVGGNSELSQDTIDEYLGETAWFLSDVPVQTGALDSLIASGLLGSISGQDLRSDIASWPSNIEYLKTQLSQDYTSLENMLMPFLRDHGYLPQIAVTWTSLPGHPEIRFPDFPVVPKDKFDHAALLADKRFHNVLVTLWSVQNDAISAYLQASEWLDITIALIDQEIGPSVEFDRN